MEEKNWEWVTFKRLPHKGKFVLVLGSVENKIVLGWLVESVHIGRTNHRAFLIGGGKVKNVKPFIFTLFNIDDVDVIPTTPVSPLHYFLALKRKLPENMRIGVVLLQFGHPVPVLLAAARSAFYNLDLPQCKILNSEHKIGAECVSLPRTIGALVTFFIKKYTGKEPSQQELRSILSLLCSDDQDMCYDVADEGMLLQCLDAEDVNTFQDHSVGCKV